MVFCATRSDAEVAWLKKVVLQIAFEYHDLAEFLMMAAYDCPQYATILTMRTQQAGRRREENEESMLS